jgi:hypothetical protein
MAQLEPIRLNNDAFQSRLSRRAIIKYCGAVGLSLSGVGVHSSDALALPAVRVAAPTIVRGDGCRATVSVVVTLSGVTRGVRYEAYGDVMESDDPDDDADLCCALVPQSTTSEGAERLTLELKGQVMAADLGLVKGIGPASDETFSPDLVELFARVWVRDLTAAVESGPWDSPLRVAVASTALAWTESGQFPGSELLIPRGGVLDSTRGEASRPLPPQACAS